MILTTQQHLVINPMFIAHLTQQTRASNPLVLVDESNLLIRCNERVIHHHNLNQYILACEDVLSTTERISIRASHQLELSRLLQQASTFDLREGEWPFTSPARKFAANVQEMGRQMFGDKFRFPGHDLEHFRRSDPASRERLPGGDVRFAVIPYLGRRFIIFSGSMAKELARYRLDPNHARPTLVSPLEGYRFEHPMTRWFNINSLEGAAKYFPGNRHRILDFYAAKIEQNIHEGKRTLLVSRKRFLRTCRDYLLTRLGALGVTDVKIVTGNWNRHDLNDPRTLALINYGLAGVNRFERFDSAYCLNCFFVTAEAVAQAVQDIDSSSNRYPIQIVMEGRLRRRSAQVILPDAREPITPHIAQEVLIQKEADVIVQAVGRVRPFTRPREVITFYAGELPGVRYTLEFHSLAQARSYFQIETPSQAAQTSREEQACRLKAMGKTNKEIAGELGVSISTVKRYLKKRGVHE